MYVAVDDPAYDTICVPITTVIVTPVPVGDVKRMVGSRVTVDAEAVVATLLT